MAYIANYLINHYKGKYRLLHPYNLDTNQFERDEKGNFVDRDTYIKCQFGVRIFYYGNSILHVYVPSKQRGRNYVKAITEKLGKEVILNIQEGDTELLFKIHAKHMEDIEGIVKPSTLGAGISPFSTKNLPKTKYTIPDEDLALYKDIIKNVLKNKLLTIKYTTDNYLKSLTNKKYTWEDIKADMALKGLRGKEYIHAIGKWQEYMEYLKVNIEKS